METRARARFDQARARVLAQRSVVSRGTCVAVRQPMTSGTARTLLQTVEEAASAALTLAEGLELEELLRSRLTRREVKRQLLIVAATLSELGQDTRDAMPELDWEAWRAAALVLASAEQSCDDTLWATVHSLTPATLTWLRLYRSQGARAE